MNPSIDLARLTHEMDALAAITHATQTGRPGERAVTRVVFTDDDLRARAWLKARCVEAGLSVREDAIGNMFAQWSGMKPELPAVGTGSHTDAVPHAGMYDGTLGVLGGLEAIRALQRTGLQPQRSIELVMFTAEEPTRFGIGCLGSRVMSGSLAPANADALHDSEGSPLARIRQAAGYSGDLATVRTSPSSYSAWLELHIEQGALLERNGVDIGVVTHIAAPASSRFVLEGIGGHAGALLMADRRDALPAAAELILAVEAAARLSGSADTVATVGTVEVHPGAVNSVPSRVTVELDLRDTDPDRRDRAFAKIRFAAADIAVRRNVTIQEAVVNADPPATCSNTIVSVVEQACERAGLRHMRMVSRAYHDSLFMARLAPIGMIFVPCRNGVSHRPDEYCSPAAMEAGVRVLAESLRDLADTP